jgi:uncharacterized protein YhhL (DUF1145 family)
MKAWSDFTVITAGAAAALVGLLFVAVSIRADTISASKGLRSRVAQVLTLFLGLLASSILVSLPNPATWVLGVELIVVAILTGVALLVLDDRAERATEREWLERVLDRLSPNFTTAILIGLSGIALAFGFEWGLFILALAALIGFIGGAVVAWFVLVRPQE